MTALTVVVLLFIFSCQNNEDNFIEIEANNFSIEQARSWFEANNNPIMAINTNSPVYANKNLEVTSNKKPVLLQNDWKHAFKTKKGNLEVIEVPIKSNGWFSYSDKESWDIWMQTKNYGYIRSITRLVIIKDKKKKTIKSYLMTIKGSKDYLEKNSFRYGANTYLVKEKDFEGVVFFHTLEGDFINGWKINNGTVIGKIKESSFESKNVDSRDYTCQTYDVYANYEICSYAHTGYEENEEGDLVAIWEFRGCEYSSIWFDRFDICEYTDGGEPVIDDEPDSGGGSNDDNIINNLDGYTKCVYDELIKLGLFKGTIGNFIDNPTYHIQINNGICPNSLPDTKGCTNGDYIDSGLVIITITNNYGSNYLNLAKTILHEGIHAELYRYVNSFQNGIDPNNRPRLMELYYEYKDLKNSSIQYQHWYMTEKYVTPIASAIRELDNNKYPLEYYMGFGWDGLARYGLLDNLLTEEEITEYERLQEIVNANTTFNNECN